MKKMAIVLMLTMVMLVGCGTIDWTSKMENGYFDKDGKRAGFSGSWPCIKQGLKEAYPNTLERQFRTAQVIRYVTNLPKGSGIKPSNYS